MSCKTKFRSRILLICSLFAMAVVVLGVPQAALAQGVDDAVGPFQMEGDATKTANICFLAIADGGPAIATPGSYPPGNTQCPTVNPAGAAATWHLVPYGALSDDWSSFGFSNSPAPHFTNKAHSLFIPAFIQDAVSSASDNTFLGASLILSMLMREPTA